MKDNVLEQLLKLSRNLGDPANDYVILAEGNTSAKVDEETFWVKASGTQLRTMTYPDFVQIRFDTALALLGKDVDDQGVKDGLNAAKVDSSVKPHPSVETILHALALQLDGINFVGHTHPTAINALTCSVGLEKAVSGRLFPDEIVICGPAPVIVPYTDPGLPLARKVRDLINRSINILMITRKFPKSFTCRITASLLWGAPPSR